jgi:hypothetical protein
MAGMPWASKVRRLVGTFPTTEVGMPAFPTSESNGCGDAGNPAEILPGDRPQLRWHCRWRQVLAGYRQEQKGSER